MMALPLFLYNTPISIWVEFEVMCVRGSPGSPEHEILHPSQLNLFTQVEAEVKYDNSDKEVPQ